MLYIFNPEHEHALAANLTNFTPPHAARQLRGDLGYLPMLWAQDGDMVLVEDVETARSWAAKLKLHHRQDVSFVTWKDLARFREEDINGIEPWGWNLHLAHKLEKAGIDKAMLPCKEWLERVRSLSHRRVAASVLEALRCEDEAIGGGHIIIGEARECYTLQDVMTFLEAHEEIVVKAPWSCSGRGVRYITQSTMTENIERWMAGVLSGQGSLIAEVKLSKVEDFAVEYNVTESGKVKAIGLSLFSTSNAAYTGNILMTEAEKREYLSRYIAPAVLDHITQRVAEEIEKRLDGKYKGPLGVDMMIVATDGAKGFLVNPCVEINLRRTMGHVALALQERGHRGTMSVVYENKQYKLKMQGDFK